MTLQELQPQVMMLLGAIFQYARGYKSFSEVKYHGMAIALATGAYLLFTPIDVHDWRLAVAKGLLGVSGLATSFWGGTFLASNSAKAGITVFPLTNSK